MGRYAKTKLMELDVSKFFFHDKRGSKLATKSTILQKKRTQQIKRNPVWT